MAQPPPFRPFSPDPTATAQANAMAFIDWVADAIFRVHELSRANYAYAKATYEHQAAQARHATGAPQQAGGVQPSDILSQLGRIAYSKRKPIGRFISGLFRP